jgi:hypothetical protein
MNNPWISLPFTDLIVSTEFIYFLGAVVFVAGVFISLFQKSLKLALITSFLMASFALMLYYYIINQQ